MPTRLEDDRGFSSTRYDEPAADEAGAIATLPSFSSPVPKAMSKIISELDLDQTHPYQHAVTHNDQYHHSHTSDLPTESDGRQESSTYLAAVPPSLLSPAFTPPSTPGTGTPAPQRQPAPIPVDSAEGVDGGAGAKQPKLLETLPNVNCLVGATIPTYVHLDRHAIQAFNDDSVGPLEPRSSFTYIKTTSTTRNIWRLSLVPISDPRV